MTAPAGSVLVITQPPHDGGVPAKTRLLCRYLRAQGRAVTVAWYATFGHDGDLNAPLWRAVAGRRPTTCRQACFGDFPGIAIGCWAPELEAPYYLPSNRWRDLIAAHDRHVAVGGPPLIGHLLASTGTPGLLWCASDVVADRRDRVAAMPPLRRALHDVVSLPWLRRMQARTLKNVTRIMGVSRYTVDRLAAQGCPRERLSLLHIPVDVATFTPPEKQAAPAVLGFAARFEDPRKNLGLALAALARLRSQGIPARLRLSGAEPSVATRSTIEDMGLDQAVEFLGELPVAALPDFYRSLDVFVLPSHQEGLCIAGLEAMACGVPVVSTRCGGPEDYVRHGETGCLVDTTAQAMAQAVTRIVEDRDLRRAMADKARLVAEREFSHAAFTADLARCWHEVWGEQP